MMIVTGDLVKGFGREWCEVPSYAASRWTFVHEMSYKKFVKSYSVVR